MRATRLWIVVTASALLAGAGWAQPARKYDASNTATVAGTNAEKGTITLRDEQRGEFVVQVDEHTRLERGGDDVELSGLETGERVVVDLRRAPETSSESETLVADRVQVVVDPPAAEAE